MAQEDVGKDIALDLSDRNLYTIYNEYSSSVNGIFYYQDQQIELRTICIKILLGTFAILGVLFYHNIFMDDSIYLYIFSITPVLSLLIVLNLLFQDLVYREGLKIGFFSEAINLEKNHPWIPAFHRCLVSEGDIHQKPGAKQAFFYFISIVILLILSIVGVSFLPVFNTLWSQISIWVFGGIIYALLYGKIRKSLIPIISHLQGLDIDSEYYKKVRDGKKDLFLSLLHTKGREYIEHYSSIKMKYKKLVIAVLTAVLIGLSYISNSKQEIVHINQIYLIVFVVIISLIGLNLIRYLDINISHKQVRLLFGLMIKIEDDHEVLSSPYSKIKKILYKKNSDPAIFDYLYYGSINFGLIIVGSIFLILNLRDYHELKDIIITFCILAIFLLWEFVGINIIYRGKLSKKIN
ncbi:MAG: hypothetical protein K1000chlam3_00691 [Chlamydiae bacterium]|nr:hypothetical protein [Chlamydiota bacterium]